MLLIAANTAIINFWSHKTIANNIFPNIYQITHTYTYIFQYLNTMLFLCFSLYFLSITNTAVRFVSIFLQSLAVSVAVFLPLSFGVFSSFFILINLCNLNKDRVECVDITHGFNNIICISTSFRCCCCCFCWYFAPWPSITNQVYNWLLAKNG